MQRAWLCSMKHPSGCGWNSKASRSGSIAPPLCWASPRSSTSPRATADCGCATARNMPSIAPIWSSATSPLEPAVRRAAYNEGMSESANGAVEVAQAVARLDLVRKEIGKVIVGQQDVVDGVLICLLSGGHVLLEGVPGLGKTTLLRTLSRVLHLKYSRIQFTPDLMPADIVGSMIIETNDHGSKSLRFQPGPIFANLVLADEINRATPKTQSALLEAMQERTVTSGTTTHELEAPFLVMATQNPIEMEGTYPLPEAQLDRFLMKILVAYPSREDLNRIVERTVNRDETPLHQVVDRDAIMQ